jgi:hypothetical protein
MRGMYLHAERLLAKAGRQSARGGVSPIRSKAEDERSEGLHKRSAEDCWETPCAAPGQRPQRGLVSLSACIKNAGIVRVALRQEQAAEEGGGRRKAAGDRRGGTPPCKHERWLLPKYSGSREDGDGTDTHRPGVWKPQTELNRGAQSARWIPLPLRSGSLRRMSRPLKLKVAGTVLCSVFQLPDQGFIGLFAGAHRRRLSLVEELWCSLLELGSFFTHRHRGVVLH